MTSTVAAMSCFPLKKRGAMLIPIRWTCHELSWFYLNQSHEVLSIFPAEIYQCEKWGGSINGWDRKSGFKRIKWMIRGIPFKNIRTPPYLRLSAAFIVVYAYIYIYIHIYIYISYIYIYSIKFHYISIDYTH